MCACARIHGHRFISETFNWKIKNKQMRIDFSIVIALRAHPRRARRPPLSETITLECWRNARFFIVRAVAAVFSFYTHNNRSNDDNVKNRRRMCNTGRTRRGMRARLIFFSFLFYSCYSFFHIHIILYSDIVNFHPGNPRPDSDYLRRARSIQRTIAVDHRLFRYGYIIISRRDRHRDQYKQHDVWQCTTCRRSRIR